MGMNNTIEDIPLELIQEGNKTSEEVSLRITRRNDKGQVATVYNGVLRKTLDLANIDEWLREMAGGGRYRVEPRDPNNPTQYVVQPFHVNVEGPPRPPRHLGSPQDATPYRQYANQYGVPVSIAQGAPNMYDDPYGGGGGQPPYGHPGAPPPSWAQGLHGTNRVFYQGPVRERPAPGATMASDQLAVKQLEEMRAESKATIAKLEAMVERLNDEVRRRDEALAQEREKAREERHKIEMEMLRQQMALLAQPKPQESNNKLSEIGTALAPFAPVFAAMVQSRESSSAKSMELQQQGLMQLMQATLGQANKPDPFMETIKQFGPMLLPFIKDMMEAKSPKAQAELFNAMVENNLNSVAMMAQLIEAFASAGSDKEEPWYLPMIREALGGTVGMMEAYMQSKGGLPGQKSPPDRQLARPKPAQQHQPVQPAGYRTVESTPQEPLKVQSQPQAQPQAQLQVQPQAQPQVSLGGFSGVQQAPSNGEVSHDEYQMAEVVEEPQTRLRGGVEHTLTAGDRMLLMALPPDFQTPEWRAIVIGLHRDADVEEISNVIASHLEHLINFNMLPEVLEDLQDDPARALDRCLAPLPVTSRNPNYIRQVMQAVIEILDGDGFFASETEEVAPHEAAANG